MCLLFWVVICHRPWIGQHPIHAVVATSLSVALTNLQLHIGFKGYPMHQRYRIRDPCANSMFVSELSIKFLSILKAALLRSQPTWPPTSTTYFLQMWPRSLPFLIVPVISGGPLANGKLKWKYFSLLLHASQPIEQVRHSCNLQWSACHALSQHFFVW